MRILEVRFKNLNSLVGEWRIDFTHPDFVDDGIFAIIGPTGAGKTTILDAICLALYGCTPRLNKVTKGSNEIMARRTSDCYAEVTFETQTGQYRCHWSQHRARKKADGELQSPKREIANVRTNTLLEEKSRGVDEKIEAVTGMDFRRFTRSMLLAQGEFAAFLQATPDERSPILEQITGSEIYTNISIRVHKRDSEEQKERARLKAKLDGISLLTPDQEQNLQRQWQEKNRHEMELSQFIKSINQAMVWQDTLTRIEQELSTLAERQQALQIQQEHFAPTRLQLKRAMNTLELAGDDANLNGLRGAQEADRHSRVECRAVLPKQLEAVSNAEKNTQQVTAFLDTKKVERMEGSRVIQKVRELDVRLEEKNNRIREDELKLKEQEKIRHSLFDKQSRDTLEQTRKNQTLEKIQKNIRETQGDESLVEQLAGIRSRLDGFKQLNVQYEAKCKEVQAAQTAWDHAARKEDEQVKNRQIQQQKQDVLQSELDQKQQSLKQTLGEAELTVWRQRVGLLKDKKIFFVAVCGELAALAESRQRLGVLDLRQQEVAAEQNALAEHLQNHLTIKALLERSLVAIDENLYLLHQIQNLEEARHQLQDGKPCPLCGAELHPYAQGNVPNPEADFLAREEIKTKLDRENKSVSEIQIKQAKGIQELEHITARQREYADTITQAETRLARYCVELAVESADPNLGNIVLQCQADNETQLDHATRIVQTAEALEKEVNSQRDSLELINTSVALAEKLKLDAAHEKSLAQQTLEQGQKESEKRHIHCQEAREVCLREVSAYGIETLSTPLLDGIQNQLTRRRDQWLARHKEKAALDQDLSILKMQIDHRQAEIQKTEHEIKQREEALQGLRGEQASLRRERYALFGDQNPNQEEARLEEAVLRAEEILNSAQKQLHETKLALTTLKSKMAVLDRAMLERVVPLERAEAAFLSRLGALGFVDEADYKAACLPEEVRQTLRQQQEQLDNEQNRLIQQKQEKTTQCANERERRLTDQSREDLQLQLTTLETNKNTLLQEIGGIHQQLSDYAIQQEKQKDCIKEVDAQDKECKRWTMLHSLIGSGDGKRYRNFAQGLTFERIILQANRQLQKMTDRYLLIKDAVQPLDLNIIDLYQAESVRSTKNLSGGESFIVSLALALGLSHMASKNVRVDSLFLDEGFGTLDEDALSTALDTLAGLRQEGKQIGIISHVPALKERIHTQIQVVPQSGGKSILKGAGVAFIK